VSILLTLGEAGSRIPVPLGLLRRAADAGCVVLLAHDVVDHRPPPHLAWTVGYKTTARFEADLTWLLRRYRFVGYDDVEASLAGARKLPANAALLTFDDGYAELHSIAWPILRRLGVPALVFLTTSALDNVALTADCRLSLCVHEFVRLARADQRSTIAALGLPDFAARPAPELGRELCGYLRSHDGATQALWQRLALDEEAYLREVRPYLTTEQVRELAAHGWSVGGHGVVHRHLQGLSRDELEGEIVESCAAASRLSGRARAPFAFPYSGQGVRRDWLAEIRARHGHVGLFFDVHGIRREGSLVWHRVDIERPNESIATTVRRAHLGALLPPRVYESVVVAHARDHEN
jgi:peptidoglycan/xylan/chitin deacetylase (PgdA/CDA1 family)